jgi:hypothetical protein
MSVGDHLASLPDDTQLIVSDVLKDSQDTAAAQLAGVSDPARAVGDARRRQGERPSLHEVPVATARGSY